MAGTGGTVTILFGRVGGCTVTITGAGTFTVVGGGAASFPETVTTSKGLTTVTDGDYTISASVLGREILNKVVRLQGGNGDVLNVEPNRELLFDLLLPQTATTAQLASAASTINTVGKFAGKSVYNTTANTRVSAIGGNATDHWYSAAGADTHTPV